MERIHKRYTSGGIALGVAAFLIAAIVTLILLGILGSVTGQIAMCATGPEWWSYLFWILVLTLPLSAGITIGIWSARKYSRDVSEWNELRNGLKKQSSNPSSK